MLIYYTKVNFMPLSPPVHTVTIIYVKVDLRPHSTNHLVTPNIDLTKGDSSKTNFTFYFSLSLSLPPLASFLNPTFFTDTKDMTTFSSSFFPS